MFVDNHTLKWAIRVMVVAAIGALLYHMVEHMMKNKIIGA